MNQCRFCGRALKPDEPFCPNCGSAVLPSGHGAAQPSEEALPPELRVHIHSAQPEPQEPAAPVSDAPSAPSAGRNARPKPQDAPRDLPRRRARQQAQQQAQQQAAEEAARQKALLRAAAQREAEKQAARQAEEEKARREAALQAAARQEAEQRMEAQRAQREAAQRAIQEEAARREAASRQAAMGQSAPGKREAPPQTREDRVAEEIAQRIAGETAEPAWSEELPFPARTRQPVSPAAGIEPPPTEPPAQRQQSRQSQAASSVAVQAKARPGEEDPADESAGFPEGARQSASGKPPARGGGGANPPRKPKKKSKKGLVFGVLAAVLVIAAVIGILFARGVLPFGGQGGIALTQLATDRDDIPLEEEQVVLFTVSLDRDPGEEVVYLKNGASQLRQMHDDGQDGDLVAGDGVYSARLTVKEADQKNVYYYAQCGESRSNDCQLCFFHEFSRAEFAAFETMLREVDDLPGAASVLEYVAGHEEVREYTQEDGRITFTTTTGLTAVYDPEIVQDVRAREAVQIGDSGGSGDAPAPSPASGGTESPAPSAAPSPAPGTGGQASTILGKADTVTFRPFRNNGFAYDDFKDAGEVIAASTGGTSRCVDDDNVTLASMKSWGGYRFVLLDSHGTLSDWSNAVDETTEAAPYLLTGEVYSADKAWTSADWASGRIVVCLGGDFTDGMGYVAVGARFFDKYYAPHDLDNAVIFLGTCYSMKDDSIARVLQEKGASVVFGFSDTVSVGYCNQVLQDTIVDRFVQSAETAGAAYQGTVERFGARDPYNTDCTYLYSGASAAQINRDERAPVSDPGTPETGLGISPYKKEKRTMTGGVTWDLPVDFVTGINGETIWSHDGDSTSTFTLDESGRILSETVQGADARAVYTYTYNAAGRLVEKTGDQDGGARFTYTYDEQGGLQKELSRVGDVETEIVYTRTGEHTAQQAITIRMGGKVLSTVSGDVTYEESGFVKKIAYKDADGTEYELTCNYTTDSEGKVTDCQIKTAGGYGASVLTVSWSYVQETGQGGPLGPSTTAPETDAGTSSPDPAASAVPAEELFRTMPRKFVFTSGVGAWSTEIALSADGTFVGEYKDTDAGDSGERYPNGTVHYCSFRGRFAAPKLVAEKTYSTRLDAIEWDGVNGETSYADGVRTIVSDPYGFDKAGEFMIYAPGFPVSDLPEGFLSWCTAWFDPDETETLPYYGLYNIAGQEGFLATP